MSWTVGQECRVTGGDRDLAGTVESIDYFSDTVLVQVPELGTSLSFYSPSGLPTDEDRRGMRLLSA
jgi:hypothetical protein